MKNLVDASTFYLGNIVDPVTGEVQDKPLLYDSKNLVTHAVCLGMTGSGKTGLGIALLEDAGLANIPAIIIDPKGDLANLLLTFPHLSAEEFLPWIDPLEAKRKGVSTEEYAEETAKTWREGLSQSHEKIENIQKLKDAVDMVVYTPANSSGVPISILRSFAAPSEELQQDTGAFRDRVLSLTSTILGLLGINADPIKSREHILISSIIDHCWRQGTNLDLAQLIQLIQKPPIEKIGALDIETFFPTKERMALAINLNNLLAAPGFQAWMEGEPLDIQQLLYTSAGKPKLSIFSIAHLSDSERMFFVTLLLNEVISWMRQQPGTSNLRALLYMDEIFGYFPPTAMPPSKMPMLTLLKQARAYGIGIVLATQNPVDLDYKGLANCGTWFIGRLQTERDKARVTEGLKIASNGNLDNETLDKMLAGIGKRVFLMRSIYEPAPILFKTKWTLSYLRGPLTLAQLQTFKKPSSLTTKKASLATTSSSKPIVSSSIMELFAKERNSSETVHFEPRLLGMAKLHFVDSKNKIDVWRDVSLVASTDEDGKEVFWAKAQDFSSTDCLLTKEITGKETFDKLPAGLMQPQNFTAFEKNFASFLYENNSVTLYQCAQLGLTSKENESEEEFRAQVFAAQQQKQNEAVEKIRSKFESKKMTLEDKLKNAEDRLASKQQKSFWQKIETFISILTTLLGAFVGRKITKGTITQAGTTLRRTGRLTVGSQEAERADETYQGYQKQLDDLKEEMNKEIEAIPTITEASQIQLEMHEIHPRKGDIRIEKMALLWVPEGLY